MTTVATEIIKIDPDSPEPDLIGRAAAVARTGAPIIFPTDTVYGIGIAALPGNLPDALYEAKQRNLDKAIPWLVADADALDVYAHDVPEYARMMAKRHWPGALTLIVKASKRVAGEFRADDGSIALRAPASQITLELIRELGVPLVTTSANMQGQPPAISVETLDDELAKQVKLVIDGGECTEKVASTIVSCLGDEPIIIRQGAITEEGLWG